jgi:hypothetical protein
MRRLKRFEVGLPCLLATLGMLCAFHSSGCSAGDEVAAQPPVREGAFAVIELFTSEGCSSCPPADALLGEIAEDARRRGISIYPIAFHIDYWDGLGWKDRFSLNAATDRQQKYAKTLGCDVYTPQMIVNGRTQFVGSDRDAYQRAVAQALGTPSSSRLTLVEKKVANGDLTIGYNTTDVPDGSVLNLVMVQRSATTDVPRGENAGRTLHHFNIVRSIQTIPLRTTSGESSVKLPSDLEPKDAMVIGYAQNAQSLQIIAAAQAAVTVPAQVSP